MSGKVVNKKKVVFVLGTRPEAIKLAPVVLRGRCSPVLECRVLCTGQHREMVDQALQMFNLVPDIDLNVMTRGQELAGLTARLFLGIDGYLKQSRPDIVVVQGDTTSALSAAQVAFYRGVAIAHVEAGLRTLDKKAPFPEEMNRVLISHLSDIHFAPTEGARENLRREGIDEKDIYVTGNTVVDALNIVLPEIVNAPPHLSSLPGNILEHSSPLVLITGHRRENHGPGLREICLALRDLAASFRNVSFVYPVHLNPNVYDTVTESLKDISNIYLIEPLRYQEMLYLMSLCDLIITDSGGIQEEAPSFGKRVIVTRTCTERPEGIAAGLATLVGCDRGRIVAEASRLLREHKASTDYSISVNPYGDGRAAERIVRILSK